MKKLKVLKVIVMVLVLSMVSTVILPINNITAQAATAKISKKKLMLEVGKSKTLKLTGLKGKITWTSSKSSVATVNKNGKVTAKKAGTATITAKVNKKKYTCKVTVFKTQKVTSGKVKFLIPNDWTVLRDNEDDYLTFTQHSKDMNINMIMMWIEETGIPKPDDKTAKVVFDSLASKESLKKLFLNESESISNYKTGTYDSKWGTVDIATFTINSGDLEMKAAFYHFYTDDYVIMLLTMNGYKSNYDLNDLVKYIIDSIIISED